MAGASLGGREDPRPADETLYIRAGRVIVRPGTEVEGTKILVGEGRILAMGPDVTKPEGARELEAPVVCAGFLDPWSALGLSPDVLRDESATPASRAVDGVDVYSGDHLRLEALRAGVTCVRVQSGATARVGGVGTVVRIAPDLAKEEAVILADADLAMGLGLSAESPVPQIVDLGSASRAMDPFERIAELDRIISALDGGEAYLLARAEHEEELEEWQKKITEKEAELEKDFKKAKKDREKEQKEAEEKGKEFKEKSYKEDKRPKAPKYDEDEELMARVVDGELPLIVQAHRVGEIRGLLDGTERFERLRLILAGGTESFACADKLAERRIPVLLWPAPLGEGASDEYEGHDLSLAARLSGAGVTVLMGSGGATPGASRDLPLLAALAIGHGLAREKAFEALTIGAARALDLSDRIGTVERGKDADLLLLDGEPLASTTRLLYVIAGGRLVVAPED